MHALRSALKKNCIEFCDTFGIIRNTLPERMENSAVTPVFGLFTYADRARGSPKGPRFLKVFTIP